MADNTYDRSKKVICGSCHATATSYGNPRLNTKGQWLIAIKPHWRAGEVGGMMCSARIGVVAK